MPPRLLLIFAHPDDESFVAAGLSRRCADAGGCVTLVTATRGEAGSCGDPPLCTKEELPARREAELREAAAILRIADVHLLGYRDQHLANAPPPIVREQLVEIIRHHRPHVVVTYDPNGGHGHADHVAIARFTMDAVAAAADLRWHPAAGAAHRVQRVLWTPPVLAWDDPPPAAIEAEPGVDFLVDITPQKTVKAAALRAHRTQHRSTDRWMFHKARVDQILSLETFRQGMGAPLPSVPLDDVFGGIVVD
jgi:LmbE family N-acetylglucosaminyl deacetylase